MMKTFTKWFIIIAVILTAAVGALQQGLIQIVVKNDESYIALLCMVLFVGFSAKLGHIAFLIDKGNLNREVLEHKMQPPYFMADMCLYLGLLGTTAGLAYTINQALGASAGNPDQLMKVLPQGIGRTLYTTITALACQLLLQVQLFILDHKLNEKV